MSDRDIAQVAVVAGAKLAADVLWREEFVPQGSYNLLGGGSTFQVRHYRFVGAAFAGDEALAEFANGSRRIAATVFVLQ
jgi:hypothetical protein